MTNAPSGEERRAWLHLDGWAGRSRQPITVVGETPARWRIRSPIDRDTRLGGRRRTLPAGEIGLAPKSAVTFDRKPFETKPQYWSHDGTRYGWKEE